MVKTGGLLSDALMYKTLKRLLDNEWGIRQMGGGWALSEGDKCICEKWRYVVYRPLYIFFSWEARRKERGYADN